MGFRSKRDLRLLSRPGLEGLERRAVPATFHVSNAADLQADVAMVASSPTPNTIVVNPGTYDLTAPLRIQGATNLSIVGKNQRAASATLIAPNGNRVFDINGGNVTLTGLTIAGGGGVDHGGGIRSQNATLTLKNATVSGNTATQSGGGVYAAGGKLNVVNSSISNNGAVNPTNPAGGGIGTLNTTLDVAGSVIAHNTAVGSNLDPNGTASAIGAGIYAQGGTITITSTSLAHNNVYASTTGTSATAVGGAMATRNATATVTKSNVTGNGLIALSAGTNSMRGSAFSTNGGTLTVTGSTLAGNLPEGTAQFDHTGGAVVVIKNTTVDGQKQVASRTLSS